MTGSSCFLTPLMSWKNTLLITMSSLERFTTDSSGFSRMTVSQVGSFKSHWLSCGYCASETSSAHYSDKTFQSSDGCPGMGSIFPDIYLQYVSTKASLAFHNNRRGNGYSHFRECYFVLPIHLHSNNVWTPPRSPQRLGYRSLIFMLACQPNVNVLISLTRSHRSSFSLCRL